MVLEYKGSEVGRRVWRDIMAAPAWLRPNDTPDVELVRRDPRRGWVARTEAFGPGYRSAYGLVMLVHGLPGRGGALADHGIRTHGSASYTSVLRGQSHGCHRLFNHLALRLASFLLAHRPHVGRGIVPARYARELHAHGRTLRMTIRDRGYLYQPPAQHQPAMPEME